MLSFIGWEAVSHLAGELRDPARQLPRAIFFALGVVIVLYLGLAVATVGVLGTESPSNVPLADLMGAGLGEAGPDRHRRAGDAADDGDDERVRRGGREAVGRAGRRGLGAGVVRAAGAGTDLFAVVAAVLLAALATDLLGLDGLIKATSAAFVAVYVTSTAAGVRLLSGTGRRLAAVSFAAVLVVFAFFGRLSAGAGRRGCGCAALRRPRASLAAPAA